MRSSAGGCMPSLVKAGSWCVKAGRRCCRVSLPGQCQKLSDTASSAEAAQRLEIRDVQGEVPRRGLWVTELYRACGGRQS